MAETSTISEKKVYKYSSFLKYVPRFLLLIISLSFITSIYILVTNFSTKTLTEILVNFFAVLMALCACVYWSDLETNAEGIKLDFLGWQIKIPWSDVIKIGQVKNITDFDIWYVQVRKLNFSYKLLGLTNIGSFVPVFLITHNLKNRKELIHEIQRRKHHHHDHSA